MFILRSLQYSYSRLRQATNSQYRPEQHRYYSIFLKAIPRRYWFKMFSPTTTSDTEYHRSDIGAIIYHFYILYYYIINPLKPMDTFVPLYNL